MSQSLWVLHEIEDLTLKAVMVWDYKESDEFFCRAHIVYADRIRIHCQFLSELAEPIPQKAIDVLELMLT